MNNTNSPYSMLATHVNDLRRMWFQEHEKNKKLKEKLREFKILMKNIQSHILLNESFTEESNLSLLEIRDFSNQSTLEQTSSPNLFQSQLAKVVSNLFMKVMRESFNSLRSSKMLQKKTRLLIFLLNLQKIFQNHEILHKSHAIRCLQPFFQRSSKIFKIFQSTSGIFFRLKRFSFEEFKKKTLNLNSVDSERKKIDLGVNETSPPNFKEYFGRQIENSLEEFKSFSDSCFGGFEQARNKLNFQFDIEKNKRIIKNPKFLNFMQIFREKIIEKKNFAFQAVLFWFENSICYQEGVKLLVEILQKVVKRKLKIEALVAIGNCTRIKKMVLRVFELILYKIANRVSKDYFKKLIYCKYKNFNSRALKRLETLLKKSFKKSFNLWKNPKKPLFFNSTLFNSYISLHKLSEFPKKYTTRLKRETFLNIVKTINQEISLTCLQLTTLSKASQLLKIFTMRRLFKSFETWKNLENFEKLSKLTRSKKMVKLLADSALQIISIAFRSWQYSIYSQINFSDQNKENYYKKSLNFNLLTQPRPSKKPLQILNNSYNNL